MGSRLPNYLLTSAEITRFKERHWTQSNSFYLRYKDVKALIQRAATPKPQFWEQGR